MNRFRSLFACTEVASTEPSDRDIGAKARHDSGKHAARRRVCPRKSPCACVSARQESVREKPTHCFAPGPKRPLGGAPSARERPMKTQRRRASDCRSTGARPLGRKSTLSTSDTGATGARARRSRRYRKPAMRRKRARAVNQLGPFTRAPIMRLDRLSAPANWPRAQH